MQGHVIFFVADFILDNGQQSFIEFEQSFNLCFMLLVEFFLLFDFL